VNAEPLSVPSVRLSGGMPRSIAARSISAIASRARQQVCRMRATTAGRCPGGHQLAGVQGITPTQARKTGANKSRAATSAQIRALRLSGPSRRDRSQQAIARADAVTGNAARLVGAPTLCLCKAQERRPTRILLVPGRAPELTAVALAFQRRSGGCRV
jgi:hypothetical protein